MEIQVSTIYLRKEMKVKLGWKNNPVRRIGRKYR